VRLWSIHPKYLDARGLVALWREALLAQAVLLGKTKGYTRHPQLLRFRSARNPSAAICAYLHAIHDEAKSRGYTFDITRVRRSRASHEILSVTRGQIKYEWLHLQGKLIARDPKWLKSLGRPRRFEPHPVFIVVAGQVESWEKGPSPNRRGWPKAG